MGGAPALGRTSGGAPAEPPPAALRLTPAPPHVGPSVRVPLDGATFWVGAAADAGLPLFLPGVAARHAAITGRADGPWLAAQRAAAGLVRRNGQPVDGGVLLTDGDVVEFAPGVAYRVELRAPTRAGPPPVARVAPPAPTAAARPPRPPWGARVRNAWQRWRRRPPSGLNTARGRRAALGWTLGTLAVLLVAGAGVLVWRAARPGGPGGEVAPPLTERQAQEYDALVSQAADHTERGAALLEIGATDAALREFGAAVTALESSPLRDNPWVRPRIDALEAGIAAVYRERRVPVPARYAAATAAAERRTAARARERGPGAAAPALARAARLSVDDFAARLAQVQQAFAARYGRPLVVTGRDHPEHVALYGAGGAVDLRVRDLTAEQVAFAVSALREAGVRVKDFSTDAVLQAQVAAARAAGLGDRAGTAVHLHADRYLDRVDRWTVK